MCVATFLRGNGKTLSLELQKKSTREEGKQGLRQFVLRPHHALHTVRKAI